MFGVRQSGILEFRIGDIFTDALILQAASEEAAKLEKQDPGSESCGAPGGFGRSFRSTGERGWSGEFVRRKDRSTMNILNIEHVSKLYGDKWIFDDISCGIQENEKIGIIGINGTGKTTLLRIIAGTRGAG